MVEISTRYEGGLRVRAEHGPSGVGLVTDAPVDNEGRGESFSPTDLVATALGTCMLTIMGIVARRHSLAIEGAEARVRKVMSTDIPRRIAALETEITVPMPSEGAHVALLERAALTCPVHHSLHAGIEKPVRFVWTGAGEGGAE